MDSDEESLGMKSDVERILSDDLKTSAVASDEGQTSTLAIEYEEHALALASDEEKISDEKLKTSAVASDEEQTLAPALSGEEKTSTLASDKEQKTLLCFDSGHWLKNYFWMNYADPWQCLWNSDYKVSRFVRAARSSNYELVVVASGGVSGVEALELYNWRPETEIEKTGLCLGAFSFLLESFEKQGVRVVRRTGAHKDDVLAAIAETSGGNSKGAGAVILSKDVLISSHDRLLNVFNWMNVVGDRKLILENKDKKGAYERRTRNSRTVQPHLGRIAMDKEENLWSQQGRTFPYRPSLWKDARIERGTTSSSDKRMGNLHSIARPLRAAVYARLGEDCVRERIPEWNEDEKMVEWKEIEVVADPTLFFVLADPLTVLSWLVARDTVVVQNLEPWQSRERMFNTCVLAAELVAAFSDGARTMLECMAFFSNEDEIISLTTRRFEISSTPTGLGPAIVQSTSQASQNLWSVLTFDRFRRSEKTKTIWR